MSENLPGRLSLHRRRLPLPARGRGSDPDVRGRGDAGAHEPPLPLPRRRASPSVRLSTAFDSVTLYGENPAERPDIYGKVGNSGVSIATVDDAKRLYSGFDLCAPSTSVSMTINGPAPIILAFFMNAADRPAGREAPARDGRLGGGRAARFPPTGRGYRGVLPETSDGLGLGLLGVSGDRGRRPRDLRADQGGDARAPCAGRCRPTSSRRTRPRTRASSRPSSR